MKVLGSLAAVGVLFLVGLLGATGPVGGAMFGIVIPYLVAAIFLAGVSYRVLSWARAPVPFRIPTTCGQQESLPWIRPARLDNPSGTLGVLGRMAMEVLFFRSLLRNTKAKQLEGGRLAYRTSLGLWLGAMAFHWSLLVILLRHLRLFTDPVPAAVTLLGRADGLLELGMPAFYASSVVFLAALVYLLLRRLGSAQLRYLSLPEDYLLPLLLLGIGLSGFCARDVARTDILAVKELAVGLVSLRPTLPAPTIGALFFGHLFLVCMLLAYIPFSKVVHLAGVLLSPTRNLANNSRRVRHVNPWDCPVKVHSYEAYEDELREKMKGAGIPVERS
jgi:nitrate reductase gamma subunit